MTVLCAAQHAEETPAEDGLLCYPDAMRLRDYLGAREGQADPRHPERVRHGLPWMWEHLAVAYPSLVSFGEGGGSGPEDREAERLAAVLALRADIRDWLGDVAADLMGRTSYAGPAGVTLSPDSKVRHIGTDWAIVSSSASWLLAQVGPLLAGHGLPVEVAADNVAALLWQADGLASRAHALAPWRPAPTAKRDLPCRCGTVGSVYDHGDALKCWSCGRSYSLEDWDVLMKVMVRRAQMGA